MKKNILISFLLLFVGLCMKAQQTSMTIDNQTPGWLSSKINYGDQQTVEKLKVTGFINAADIVFLRELNTRHALVDLDLSGTRIVAGGGYYADGQYCKTEDDVMGWCMLGDFSYFKKLSLPPVKELSERCFESAIYDRYSMLEVDTLILNGAFTEFNMSLLLQGIKGTSYYKSVATNLYLPEGITYLKLRNLTTSGDNISFTGRTLEFMTFPSTIESVKSEVNANTNMVVVSYIKEPQKVRDETSNPNYPLRKWRGTIYVPKGTIDKYKESCFGHMTIKEMLDVENISIDAEILSLHVGDIYHLAATIYPNEAYDKAYSWRSVNENIATVDENGNVAAKAYGKTQIIAETKNGVKDSCDIIIYDKTTGVVMDEKIEVNIDTSVQLTAKTLPLETSDSLIFWSSNDESVASVDENGIVCGHKQGNCIITATSVNGGHTAMCMVKVLQPITDIKLDKHEMTVKAGNSIQLKTIVLPNNADNKQVVWTSSNEDIATISMDGIVIAKKPGEVIIMCKSVENEDINDACRVTVVQPVTGITLDKNDVILSKLGETVQLIPTIQPEDASNKAVRWSSSKENVCTVSDNGTVVALSDGVSIVIATAVDGGFVAVCTVNVTTLTGIENINISNNEQVNGFYTIDGLRFINPQKGLNIVKMKNGTIKKILVK